MFAGVDPYAWYAIKKYKHWRVYLHPHQYPYLGRCYASALRLEADIITDMTPQERQELFELIVPRWYKTVQEVYGECRPNFAIMGNDWEHLHAHMIPRYVYNPVQDGIAFEDANRGSNYAPYLKNLLYPSIMASIKIAMMTGFNSDPTQ